MQIALDASAKVATSGTDGCPAVDHCKLKAETCFPCMMRRRASSSSRVFLTFASSMALFAASFAFFSLSFSFKLSSLVRPWLARHNYSLALCASIGLLVGRQTRNKADRLKMDAMH